MTDDEDILRRFCTMYCMHKETFSYTSAHKHSLHYSILLTCGETTEKQAYRLDLK